MSAPRADRSTAVSWLLLAAGGVKWQNIFFSRFYRTDFIILCSVDVDSGDSVDL